LLIFNVFINTYIGRKLIPTGLKDVVWLRSLLAVVS
jgi:hypothetical protein